MRRRHVCGSQNGNSKNAESNPTVGAPSSPPLKARHPNEEESQGSKQGSGAIQTRKSPKEASKAAAPPPPPASQFVRRLDRSIHGPPPVVRRVPAPSPRLCRRWAPSPGVLRPDPARIDQESPDPDALVHLRAPAVVPPRAQPAREAGLRRRAYADKDGGEGEPPRTRRGDPQPRRRGGHEQLEGRADQPALREGQALRPLLRAAQRAPQAQARVPLRRGGGGGHGRGPLRRRPAVQAAGRQEVRRVCEEVHAGRRLPGEPGRRPEPEVVPEKQQGDEEGLRCRRQVVGGQGEEGQHAVVSSQDLSLELVVLLAPCLWFGGWQCGYYETLVGCQ